MNTRKTSAILSALILLLSLTVITGSALAKEEYQYFKPIEYIDLGLDDLALNVGDTYTFTPTWEPAETPSVFLDWLTDESILQIDPETFTVTAVGPGTTRLMVETNAGYTWDYCDVIVSGPQGKEVVEKRAGAEMVSLSGADRKKIKADSFLNYIDFIEFADFTDDQYETYGQRMFNLTALVNPGTVEEESDLAAALGMEKALPLPDLDAVSLYGTFVQIIAFLSGNTDLVELIEFAPFALDDPLTDLPEDALVGKAMNLQGSVEALTSVSVAHNLNLKGSGTVVAIVDSGINRNHEQFAGRVIAEACYALSSTSGLTPSCTSGSALPSAAKVARLHNHGFHVAGIAAGRDGIAPNAQIVAINISCERCSGSSCSQSYYYSPYEVAQYLVSLQKLYKSKGQAEIVAVNYSLGSQKYSSSCDSQESTYKAAFQLLIDNGMIPVAASGNEGYDGYIGRPGCVTSAFSVGALANSSTPTIAAYSNHSPLVDILAPGSNILSAFYAYESGYSTNSCSVGGNCYGRYSGTSMATPMVTGAFAILKQAYPGYTPAQLKSKIVSMSTKTANYRPAGSTYSSSLTNPAKTFSYTKPVLDFSGLNSYGLDQFSVAVNDIRGYTAGITVKFKPLPNVSGVFWLILDLETGEQINDKVNFSWEKYGSYDVFRFEKGDMAIGGHPYQMNFIFYRMVNGTRYTGPTNVIYGSPNPRITAITAMPTDKGATFRVVKHAYADGFRYNLYADGNTSRLKYVDVTGSSMVKSVSGLTNGQLYYVTAIPYTTIKGNKYWGASQYRIYFVPLSKPAGAKVTFTSSSAAKITTTADSAATGIRVLYRVAGGALQNGCEASGSSCTVTGLNQNKAYEFYIMKYKTVNGKKHYGPGALVNYKSTASGLPAPAKPLIAKRGASLLSFTIVKDSKATGISVLYREGEGDFKLACEKSGTASQLTCQKDGFSWSKDYTFYIMQYRTSGGKKIYSPGITVTNWLTPKSVDVDADFTDLAYTADSEPADLYDVLEDYCTEDDLLFEEALAMLGEDLTAKAVDEDEIVIDADMDWFMPMEDIDIEAVSLAEDADLSLYSSYTLPAVSGGKSAGDEAGAASGGDSGSGYSLWRIGDDDSEPVVPSFENR